jgi:hypothetical protein
VFVNNVSFGLYAEAVQREGYREAKLSWRQPAGHDGLRGRRRRPVLGSGHPDNVEQQPFLGLIASSNVGRSWQPVLLYGKADFHVLESKGRRIVGYGPTGTRDARGFCGPMTVGARNTRIPTWLRASQPSG